MSEDMPKRGIVYSLPIIGGFRTVYILTQDSRKTSVTPIAFDYIMRTNMLDWNTFLNRNSINGTLSEKKIWWKIAITISVLLPISYGYWSLEVNTKDYFEFAHFIVASDALQPEVKMVYV